MHTDDRIAEEEFNQPEPTQPEPNLQGFLLLLQAAIAACHKGGEIYLHPIPGDGWAVTGEMPDSPYILIERDRLATMHRAADGPIVHADRPQASIYALPQVIAVTHLAAVVAKQEQYIIGRLEQIGSKWAQISWEHSRYIPAEDLYLTITPEGMISLGDEAGTGNPTIYIT